MTTEPDSPAAIIAKLWIAQLGELQHHAPTLPDATLAVCAAVLTQPHAMAIASDILDSLAAETAAEQPPPLAAVLTPDFPTDRQETP